GVRLTVWVRPGSTRPGVGGEHSGALVVRVSPRAVDGRATAAALAAIAEAFGVGRQAVTLVAGAASRMKVVDVAGGGPGRPRPVGGQPPAGARARGRRTRPQPAGGRARPACPGGGRAPAAARAASPRGV